MPAAIRFLSLEPVLGPLSNLSLEGISWVIGGGESGRAARPCDLAWVRDIISQCRKAGIAIYVKQLGSRPTVNPDDAGPGDGELLRPLRDRKGGDANEWPKDLRIREFPW